MNAEGAELAPVCSAERPLATIVHARVALGVPAELPSLVLDASPFSIVEFSHGRAQLIDSRGHGCGLFVNKHLAQQTAAALGLILETAGRREP